MLIFGHFCDVITPNFDVIFTISRKKNRFFVRFSTLRIIHRNRIKTEGREGLQPLVGTGPLFLVYCWTLILTCSDQGPPILKKIPDPWCFLMGVNPPQKKNYSDIFSQLLFFQKCSNIHERSGIEWIKQKIKFKIFPTFILQAHIINSEKSCNELKRMKNQFSDFYFLGYGRFCTKNS